jgi:uncharacterized protein (TIGR03083 family)
MTDDIHTRTSRNRLAAADLLDSLAPAQWGAETLCEGWTVRDVVAHLVSYEEIGYPGIATALVRARLRVGGMNDVRRAVYRDYGPEELVAVLRAHLRPHGLTAAFGGGIGLTDCVIHHQDIRRPLGLRRAVPPDRLVAALDFSLRAPVLPSKHNAAGVKVVATDIDWSHGEGPELSGPGEAILLALAGRGDAVPELVGPGAEMLEQRVVHAR